MTRSIVASGVAAILVHGFVLFGLQLDQPAVPLPPASGPIVVGLIARAPQPGPPSPPEPQNAVRKGPSKKPVRVPREPIPKTKGSETARPETVSEQAPALESGAEAPQGSVPRSDSAAPSAASGGSPATGNLSSELPRYRNTPAPAYPPAAKREHQEGVVLLTVEVGSNGRPIRVVVTRSSGVPSLDQAALAAVRRWSFEPARSAGLPVDSRLEIPIRFSLDD